jgi:hypothetical protein
VHFVEIVYIFFFGDFIVKKIVTTQTMRNSFCYHLVDNSIFFDILNFFVLLKDITNEFLREEASLVGNNLIKLELHTPIYLLI